MGDGDLLTLRETTRAQHAEPVVGILDFAGGIPAELALLRLRCPSWMFAKKMLLVVDLHVPGIARGAIPRAFRESHGEPPA
jgi:hypothetical protein